MGIQQPELVFPSLLNKARLKLELKTQVLNVKKMTPAILLDELDLV